MSDESRDSSVASRHGLALSGGGFRATLFHLGVIKYLRESGRLSQISHLAAVSGGSIMAAHLVLNWEKYNSDAFEEAVDELIKFIQSDVRGRILRRLLFLFPFQNSSTLVRRMYAKELFKQASLESLRGNGRPALHILSTNLSRACLTSFSTEGLFLDVLGNESPLRNARIPLDAAVAASAAFPMFYPPLCLSAHDIGVRVEQLGGNAQDFTDGGVFDNSGSRLFRKLHHEAPFDSIILSEASHRIDWDFRSKSIVSGATRSVSILQDRVADLERAAVKTLDPPFVLAEIGDSPVSRIRTDMDCFSDLEIRALLTHGYSVARRALGERGAELAPPPALDLQALNRGATVRARLFSYRDWVSYVQVSVLALVLYSLWGPVTRLAEKWMPSVSCAHVYDIATVEELITGPEQDELSQKFRRGLRNNLLAMAFERVPITGDVVTTNDARISYHSTCMLQSDANMIKLQRFDLPAGARHIRALSRNTIDDGKLYEARVWTFVADKNDNFRELNRNRFEHWSVNQEDAGRTFYTVALYDGTKGFFVESAHYSGADIDDLAGRVERLSFVVGGHVRDLGLKQILRFPAKSPLEFCEYPSEQIDDVANPAGRCSKDFDALKSHFMTLVDGVQNRMLVLDTWNAATDRRWNWVGFELSDVTSDFIFRVVGRKDVTAARSTGSTN